MSKHDPVIRLLHMRDYVRKAMKLLEGKSQTDLENDEVLCLAGNFFSGQHPYRRDKKDRGMDHDIKKFSFLPLLKL